MLKYFPLLSQLFFIQSFFAMNNPDLTTHQNLYRYCMQEIPNNFHKKNYNHCLQELMSTYNSCNPLQTIMPEIKLAILKELVLTKKYNFSQTKDAIIIFCTYRGINSDTNKYGKEKKTILSFLHKFARYQKITPLLFSKKIIRIAENNLARFPLDIFFCAQEYIEWNKNRYLRSISQGDTHNMALFFNKDIRSYFPRHYIEDLEYAVESNQLESIQLLTDRYYFDTETYISLAEKTDNQTIKNLLQSFIR